MPRVLGNLPFNRWENEVLKALRNQLPDDWVVLPSVQWTLARNGYVRDGEADFVILIPNSGLVILEVKGSREFKVGEDGVWHRKSSDGTWFMLKESPPEQAMRNMHDLTGVLTEKNQWATFPGRFSYLVVYPQGEARNLPAMFDESTIATHRHMNQLASRLRNSLDKRGSMGRGEAFTSDIIELIIDFLKNRKFSIQKVDTADDVANDLGKIERLTRQQFACLRGLFQLPNVAVVGPAGSGKTVLALWRLRALVDQGQKAIYVCYNRALAEFLRLSNSEYSEFIWSVDRLFLTICPDLKGESGKDNFHREALPFAVIDRSSAFPKYDAVIVDEGQDFSEEQIIALLEILVEGGVWAFFADWKQDLYAAGKGVPIGSDVVFHLHHNCRNAVKINEASNHYLNLTVESMPGMPVGVPPLVEFSGNPAKRAWEIARQWCGEGSVVILSPYKFEKSAMKDQALGHGLRLSKNIEDLGKINTVCFSTIKSFKGIEAAAIIVVDIGIPGEHVSFTNEDLYVACTRATTRLALICSKKNVADYYSIS